MSEENSAVGFVQVPREKSMTSVFYGIRRGARIPDGYFSDAENMSCDEYPCLSTRQKRMKIDSVLNCKGEPVDAIEYEDGIALALRNGNIAYSEKTLNISQQANSIIRIGRNLFCNPAGALIKNDLSEVEYARCDVRGNFSLTFCNEAGEDTAVVYEKPETPENGSLWYDTENKGLYRYSEIYDQYVAVAQVYFKISSDTADFSAFHEGDGIHITSEKEEVSSVIAAVFSTSIIVEGIINGGEVSEAIEFTIQRRYPDMQYICCHNNRIWGCRCDNDINEIYASKLGDPLNFNCFRGISTDSYAVSVADGGEFTGCSQVGDSVVFFKENCLYTIYGTSPSDFQTVKTECFGVQKGSEKSIVKINGSVFYKSNHGIMRLSEGSLPVSVSRELGKDIWKDAVAGTDGSKYYITMSTPAGERETYVYDISLELWQKESLPVENLFLYVRYKNTLLALGKEATETKTDPVKIGPKAVEPPKPSDYENHIDYHAAFVGYVSESIRNFLMSQISFERAREMYAEENSLDIENVTDEEVYEYLSEYVEFEDSYEHLVDCAYMDCSLNNDSRLPGSIDLTEEDRFHFYAETGIRGLENSEYKRLKNIEVRMKIFPGSKVSIAVMYDEDRDWKDLTTFSEEKTSTFRFDARLEKCDNYRLRIYGYGEVIIYSIAEVFEEAGRIGY